jgi:hypothetical protein
MTKQSSFKKLVRTRMQKTGESYSTARRHILAAAPLSTGKGSPHFPGINPATTALRILLSARGIHNPLTKAPFTEAMLLGIAGGLGAGVFTFRYEKEEFSSFFAAGRHLWHDNLAFMQGCLERLGVDSQVWESTSAAKALEQLRSALELGPVACWVDNAHLPYHGLPAWFSGGGYHLLVVQSIDEKRQIAILSDLMDDTLELPIDILQEARGRIRKDKYRLLALTGQRSAPDLSLAIEAGLAACTAGLTTGRIRNFQLAAFEDWADQLHGKSGKQSWSTLFPRGRHLWTALTWSYDCIEHYFCGGGMLRPFHAEFLDEAAKQLKRPQLAQAAAQYRDIGAQWTKLADILLPSGTDLTAQARELYDLRAESFNSPGPQSRAEIWQQLGALQARAAADFPLDQAAVDNLLAAAQQQLRQICAAERGALADLATLSL